MHSVTALSACLVDILCYTGDGLLNIKGCSPYMCLGMMDYINDLAFEFDGRSARTPPNLGGGVEHSSVKPLLVPYRKPPVTSTFLTSSTLETCPPQICRSDGCAPDTIFVIQQRPDAHSVKIPSYVVCPFYPS